VLVVRRFNKSIFWGIPLTTKNKKGKYYHVLDLGDGQHRMVILSQLRLLDSKRLVDKIGTLPKEQFATIKKKLAEILNEEEYSADITEAPLAGRLEA
jgi:mRNA interferase MazF